MLDFIVFDWLVDEVLVVVKFVLKCVELRRKDRFDLGYVVLFEFNRLRVLVEEIKLLINFCRSYRFLSNIIMNRNYCYI